MPDQIPAVVVADSDGKVISQNSAARQLLGSTQGRFCWEAVGGVGNGDSLPCEKGCALKLLAAGIDHSLHALIKIQGRRHQLACVPVAGRVVCTLSRDTSKKPKVWQTLTLREQDVLRLLAGGETTHSAAEILGVGEATIRSHVEKMRIKLDVNTRAALVASGFRFGYLD